jgi:hypothetical protein
MDFSSLCRYLLDWQFGMRCRSKFDNVDYWQSYCGLGERRYPYWSVRGGRFHCTVTKASYIHCVHWNDVSSVAIMFKVFALTLDRYGAGAAAGPVLGGVFTGKVTWRWW